MWRGAACGFSPINSPLFNDNVVITLNNIKYRIQIREKLIEFIGNIHSKLGKFKLSPERDKNTRIFLIYDKSRHRKTHCVIWMLSIISDAIFGAV